jgi:Uncharacterized conserved protein (DUF2285)
MGVPNVRQIGESTVDSCRKRDPLTNTPQAPIADTAPADAQLTEYDKSHFVTYLRLLDAAGEDAPWDEVARAVLGLDPVKHAETARRIYDSHLARARWISEHGYRDLLERPR